MQKLRPCAPWLGWQRPIHQVDPGWTYLLHMLAPLPRRGDGRAIGLAQKLGQFGARWPSEAPARTDRETLPIRWGGR